MNHGRPGLIAGICRGVSLFLILFFMSFQPVFASTPDSFALGMKAQERMGEKKYDEAVPLLVDALKQDPMNTWLRGMLAHSYYQLKRFSDAKKQYELIASVEKDNDLARFMIGVLEPLADLDLGVSGGVKKSLDQELKPYEIEQLYGKAVTYMLVGDEKKKLMKRGSGFIITEDGWAVTNHHVVENGKHLVARLPDGSQYEAKTVVSHRVEYDLAVVKLEADRPLPTVKLGDSSKVILGERAVAIGSPEGLEHTISDGLVSAWRDLGTGLKYIQISVPISHGSSGGPLFNLRGEVIGVTSAGLKEGQNLNFAIPINLVKEILQDPRPMALADLPPAPSKPAAESASQGRTDAEFIREPSGRIECRNGNIGFRFFLTNGSWSVHEEIQGDDYLLKCSAEEMQVILNAYPAKEGLDGSRLAAAYQGHFLENGFALVREFAPVTVLGRPGFIGVLEKEAEERVRATLLLFLIEGRVYSLGTWYLARDEASLQPDIQTILLSLQIGAE